MMLLCLISFSLSPSALVSSGILTQMALSDKVVLILKLLGKQYKKIYEATY